MMSIRTVCCACLLQEDLPELWDGGQDGAERIPDRGGSADAAGGSVLAQEMYRRRCRYRRCRRWYGTV